MNEPDHSNVRYRPPSIIRKFSRVLQTVTGYNHAEQLSHSMTGWCFAKNVLILGIPETSQVAQEHININTYVSGYFTI